MLRLALLLIGLGCTAGAAAAGCVESEDGLKIALEARCQKLTDANLARDGEALDALLAPDFSSEDVSGKRSNATKTIEAMLAHPRYFRETSFTTVLSIRLTETGATVGRRLETERVKKILAGMTTRLRSIEVATDEWICREDEWFWQRATTDQVDLDLDGVHVRRVRERTQYER